ncbi:MAG: hypothetical protein ABJZ83_05260 [Yoonia sp.]|uniref:hypothetical protein n=1 Tax=Yoonia sp. TaxID=2212373 RepID=UPI00326731C6
MQLVIRYSLLFVCVVSLMGCSSQSETVANGTGSGVIVTDEVRLTNETQGALSWLTLAVLVAGIYAITGESDEAP